MTSEKDSSKEWTGERERVGDRVREDGGEAEVAVTAERGVQRRDGSDANAETRRYEIGEGESPSEVVSLAVLDVETDGGRPGVADQRPMVEHQQPLYEVVDPDALDSLFGTRPGHERSGGRVRFAYEGHEVVVRAGEEVVVRDVGGE